MTHEQVAAKTAAAVFSGAHEHRFDRSSLESFVDTIAALLESTGFFDATGALVDAGGSPVAEATFPGWSAIKAAYYN